MPARLRRPGRRRRRAEWRWSSCRPRSWFRPGPRKRIVDRITDFFQSHVPDGVAAHVEQDRQGFLLALLQMNDAGRIEKMAKYPDTEPCILTSGSSGRGRAS